jgi:hypothetical protein
MSYKRKVYRISFFKDDLLKQIKVGIKKLMLLFGLVQKMKILQKIVRNLIIKV